MALFAVAPWVNGEIRSAFDEKVPRPVPLPDRSLASMLANPNYQTILALLVKYGKNEGKSTAPAPVSRQYIYKQLWPLYTMVRTRNDLPAATYKKGRKAADELTQPTFSGFMAALVDAGLAKEVRSGENRKEKYYRLTETGGMAFRFGSDPATNTLVKTVLETL
jgi:DNA-binding transcriptional ArsR family regulator